MHNRPNLDFFEWSLCRVLWIARDSAATISIQWEDYLASLPPSVCLVTPTVLVTQVGCCPWKKSGVGVRQGSPRPYWMETEFNWGISISLNRLKSIKYCQSQPLAKKMLPREKSKRWGKDDNGNMNLKVGARWSEWEETVSACSLERSKEQDDVDAAPDTAPSS